MSKAVILLSGGLDSATVMAIARNEGDEAYPISFDYGQRHHLELEAVKNLVNFFNCHERHRIIKLDFSSIVSSLTGHGEVPTDNYQNSAIPNTYVPARNTIFISYALGYAESIGASKIYIGAHSLDYSGYPDCRPEYFAQFQILIDLATKAASDGERIKILTPILEMDKSQIIEMGLKLGVDFSLTSSCYSPIGNKACGKCHSCQIRQQGFARLGLNDPIPYANI